MSQMESFLCLFCGLGFFNICALALGSNVPSLSLNTGTFCDGEDSGSVPFELPDLATIGWDGRAETFNLTHTWAFYSTKNFSADGLTCSQLSFGLGCGGLFCGDIASLRVVGPRDDYKKDSITFYEGDGWRGAEELVQADVALLSVSVASAVLTGETSWTVYDAPNYMGQAACLYKEPNQGFTSIKDTLDIVPPFPHGAITSVKKGCHVGNIHVPPSPVRIGNSSVHVVKKAAQ